MHSFAKRPLKKKTTAKADSLKQVFFYSPDERSGLHIAVQRADAQWVDLGMLVSSDYSSWGSEKRMFNPYVIRANDGTWRAVWQVNETAPCFAAAYSQDLVTWRPQDYPRMSAQGVLSPVIFKVKSDDPNKERFMVFYQTPEGKLRQTVASNDFRTFSPDKEAGEHAEDMIAKHSLLNDSITINGKRFIGAVFSLKPSELNRIVESFDRQKAEAELNSEAMKDDAQRYEGLKKLQATLTVFPKQQKTISDKLIGVFFEDISFGADGGLYAELVQNRDFEYTAVDHKDWTATTAWTSPSKIVISTDSPLSEANPHHAVLTTHSITNSGWDGIALKAGEKYDFSIFVRCIDCKKKDFTVQLTENGKTVATVKMRAQSDGWQQLTATLIPQHNTSNAQLVVTPLKKGSMAVDMVSLFPQKTFKNRKNGLRADLAQAIADLHPKFVRFPGGCMTHGEGLGNIYRWSQSVGPLQDRLPARNLWNYHQTRGLGFFEYFQFCEDIGAEPLPVLAAGVPCQNSPADANGYGGQQGGIPMDQMQAYIDDLLHLIEWANADPATNSWAKMRADAGHPAPFHLKYIGIGNEDIISTVFEERYEMIARAIRNKYPDIQIVGTAGPFHAPSADYIEGWKFARSNQDLCNLVDEHYYESPAWFINHQDYYDHYDRKGPKVYLGEYASRTRTLESALAEAIYLCNIERNGDVVAMTSYAPLLCNEKHANWNPNMIYFTNDGLTQTPSYFTQHLFGNHSGNRFISSQISISADLKTPETRMSLEKKLTKRIATSVVRDAATNRTYLKVVNALPAQLTLTVKGLRLRANAKTITLTGKPSDTAAQPVEGTVGTDDGTLTLPAYSLTVVEL
ncbi:MAG: alpha-N-arabinofuranosidase [Prevotella sp.]|nr:alpha-N-arabinofuranosidase [Prevotella sp.]